MKDVIIKDCGHTVGAGIVTINNKKIYFTNYYKILSEVYNEILDSHFSSFELLKKWIRTLSKDKLSEIIDICEDRLNQNKPLESKNIGDKWDGYTVN